MGSGALQNGSVGAAQIRMAAIQTAHIDEAAITSAKIADAAVGTAQIQNAAVDRAKIKEGAVGTLQVDDAAITRAKIQNGAIGNAQIENGVINSAKIGRGEVQEANIADASIGSAKIIEGSIHRVHIEDGAVDTAKINDASITNAKIAGAAVGTANIQNGAIVTAHILDGNITTAKVADLAVTSGKIADLAVTTAKIAQAAVTNAQIANAAVDTAQIALGAITAALIAQGAVGTAQIADASITDAKIVSLNADVISSGTLATERLIIRGDDGLIYEINAQASGLSMTELRDEKYRQQLSGSVLVARSVTAEQIAAATITANEILSGTITGGKIAASTIDSGNIKAGAITTSHLAADVGRSLDLSSNVSINQTVEKVYTDMDALIGYRLEIVSTSDLLSEDIKSTALTVRVWHGSENVTNKLDESCFRWKRVSADEMADEIWNAHHIGMKSIILTVQDILYSATYTCELSDDAFEGGDEHMAVTQNLSMVRGDTFSFDVVLSELDGASITSIYFTVKRKATDETTVFQKTLADGITLVEGTTYRVRVAPEDTNGIAAGKYAYDLQIGVGTDVYTVIMGALQITQDVTTD